MDERRLYAILGAGAAAVLLVALIDIATGDGGDDPAPTTTTPPPTTTTTTVPATATTTTLPAEVVAGDRIVQADLRTALAAMKVAYVDERRYNPDPTRLATVEPGLQYVRGLATTSSTLGVIYVEADDAAQVACVSARSPSGELFLLKFVAQGAAPGTWYARGSLLPTRCDGERLATSW